MEPRSQICEIFEVMTVCVRVHMRKGEGSCLRWAAVDEDDAPDRYGTISGALNVNRGSDIERLSTHCGTTEGTNTATLYKQTIQSSGPVCPLSSITLYYNLQKPESRSSSEQYQVYFSINSHRWTEPFDLRGMNAWCVLRMILLFRSQDSLLPSMEFH
jgi:hypothetical protein